MPDTRDEREPLELRPRLIDVALPSRPDAAVIVLHGGASRRDRRRVSPAQLSVLRMIPIARRIARAGRGRLAVFRLLNSRRGWDTTHTPVQDARWAIAEVRDRVGGAVPMCLVGHSLGGRAALLAAGEPEVVGAVALAPWVLPSDMPRAADDKPILIVHGSRDRIADPRRSETLAGRMQSARVSYVVVDGAKHAMLRHHDEFSRRAAEFAVETLLEQESVAVAREPAAEQDADDHHPDQRQGYIPEDKRDLHRLGVRHDERDEPGRRRSIPRSA